MASNPKVSIIMPNYNGGKYIGEAIESVLEQTYKNLELIIVDHGSTDNSLEVVSRYENERMRVIHLQHNGFLGEVRNRGIEASTGSLIAFIDSDDVWMKEKLEMQVNLLEADPSLALVHTDVQWIDENGKVLIPSFHQKYRNPKSGEPSGRCFKKLIGGNFISCPSVVLLKRGVLEKVGLFDPSLEVMEDYDLWLRIARHYQIGFIDRPLCQYRRHSSSMSRTCGTMTRYQTWIKVVTKAIQGDTVLHHELSSSINRTLKKYHFRISKEYFEKGQYKEARKHALMAIKCGPLLLIRHLFFFVSCLLGIPVLYRYCRRPYRTDHQLK